MAKYGNIWQHIGKIWQNSTKKKHRLNQPRSLATSPHFWAPQEAPALKARKSPGFTPSAGPSKWHYARLMSSPLTSNKVTRNKVTRNKVPKPGEGLPLLQESYFSAGKPRKPHTCHSCKEGLGTSSGFALPSGHPSSCLGRARCCKHGLGKSRIRMECRKAQWECSFGWPWHWAQGVVQNLMRKPFLKHGTQKKWIPQKAV